MSKRICTLNDNTIYLQNGAIPCFVADVLFELVCKWFILHLSKNENYPAELLERKDVQLFRL